MALVTAYLNRKDKFKLARLSRDFRHHIVPRTMVSLSFKGTQCVTESTLFQFCVSTCRKVERLEFKEVEMDLEYVNKLYEVLTTSNAFKFVSRVRHLTLSKVGFTGHPDNIGFVIVKWCQVLRLFTALESIEWIELSGLPQIINFFNSATTVTPFMSTVKSIRMHLCDLSESDQETAYVEINDFLMLFPNLESINLQAMKIAEHLGDMIPCFRQDKIRAIALE